MLFSKKFLRSLICAILVAIKGTLHMYTFDTILPDYSKDNLVLSTGLRMWIGHRKEIQKLALALRRSLKPKLSCNTPTDVAPQVLLETYSLYNKDN